MPPAPHNEQKRRVRADVLERRDRLHPGARESASAAVVARFRRLAAVRRAETLFCFVSFRSEVDTTALLAWALHRSLTTAVPLVLAPQQLCAVRISSLDDLVPGAWGIPEPRGGLPKVDPLRIDVAVVPGVAFDHVGGRVGYGGGYYDAFLPQLRPDAVRIALAFEAQLVDRVPTEDHDLGVDAVVTERRLLRCRRSC
jgi:5-formyltetrahydrofolate cyclo-ligase